MNFWQELKKPIIALSPMDGVSDAAFRFINAKYGKPDVITTEFISVDGIEYAPANLFHDFLYHQIERPVVAQVFGVDPELFYQAAQIICELGFDGMDINMGCPARSVSGRGAGAGLILTPDLASEIVKKSKQGIESYVEKGLTIKNPKVLKEIDSTKEQLAKMGVIFKDTQRLIPVSIKTRIGYDKDVAEEWVGKLLEFKPASITVHGRTLKQMYQGEADWGALKRVSEVVNRYNEENDENIVINLNGDITTPQIAKAKIEETKASGIYIGRASYGNPWVFTQIKDFLKKGEYKDEVSIAQRAEVAVEHAKLHFELKGERGFVQMRKHLAWYFKSFHGASQIRVRLMQSNSPEEVEEILTESGIL